MEPRARDTAGVAVVNQVDFVAGDGEFVAAAGCSAVQRGDITATRMARVVFDGTTCLVGELAEVDLEGVRRCAKHVDVGAGAKDTRFQAGDDNDSHLWVFEPNAAGLASASSMSTPRS